MEHEGKVIAVLPVKSGTSKSGKEWTTQEFVVETQEQYPKRACFVLFGKERIEQSNVQVGQELKVSFDIDAREWNGKWFNSLNAWKVELTGTSTMQPPSTTSQPASTATAISTPSNTVPEVNYDLPF